MRRRYPKSFPIPGVVVGSWQMAEVFAHANDIEKSRRPVCLTGETGVGKGVVAKAIHFFNGREQAYRAVCVAGIDDHFFSDAVFGHVRGAFSGADRDRDGAIKAAENGTLFFDEIGDLSLPSQLKLLRVIEEEEYFPLGSDSPQRAKVRMLFATNRNLEAMVQAGTFRQDLYHRITVHRIEIPPLRERREEIRPLIDRFAEESGTAANQEPIVLDAGSEKLVMTYAFPGNVRELNAMVVDALCHREDGHSKLMLRPGRLVVASPGVSELVEIPCNAPVSAAADSVIFPSVLPSLISIGDLLVAEAMRRTGGRQTDAARLLGISQQALSARLRRRREAGQR